jgi:hypothetical protein
MYVKRGKRTENRFLFAFENESFAGTGLQSLNKPLKSAGQELETRPVVPDIIFGNDGKAIFPTKHHGNVTLSKAKWDIICQCAERRLYRFNGEKVATTLINPDQIRHHKYEKNQLFYYKRFMSITLDNMVAIDLNAGVYFAVVIDTGTGRICTVYPVEQPKTGRLFVPARAV